MFSQLRVSIRSFVRQNSSFSQTELDALLNRVKMLGLQQPAKQNQKQNQKQHQNPRKPAVKRTSNAGDVVESKTDSSHPGFVAEQTAKTKKFTKNATAASSTERAPYRRVQVRNQSERSSVNRAAGANSKARPQKGRGARDNRRSKDSGGVPTVNPNIQLFSSTYTPNAPTLASLLETSPFTAQTPSSRVMKAYNSLKHDEQVSVSGILTGAGELAPLNTQNLKTPQLKLNAEVVVNSLNRNSTLDYDTKMKLLGPLTGVAPVKQLSA